MPNKTQLSPEGAIIAQAVARRTGLSQSVIAPNMRNISSARTDEKPVEPESLDLSSPTMTMVGDGLGSSSLVCNKPDGLRLGMHVLHRDGIDVLWSIVARRDGIKVWTLDYDSEAECEHDITAIRVWLDDMLAHNMKYPFLDRECLKLTLFNPVTGQEL
jgi:hypothetical protein